MFSPAKAIRDWLKAPYAGIPDAPKFLLGTDQGGKVTTVTLYDTGGPQGGNPDHRITTPTFMVRVRARDYSDGYALASVLHSRLLYARNLVLEGARFTYFSTLTAPAFISKDDQEYHIFTFNIQTLLTLTSNPTGDLLWAGGIKWAGGVTWAKGA